MGGGATLSVQELQNFKKSINYNGNISVPVADYPLGRAERRSPTRAFTSLSAMIGSGSPWNQISIRPTEMTGLSTTGVPTYLLPCCISRHWQGETQPRGFSTTMSNSVPTPPMITVRDSGQIWLVNQQDVNFEAHTPSVSYTQHVGVASNPCCFDSSLLGTAGSIVKVSA